MGDSHTNLLYEAKQHQKQSLEDSDKLSHQLRLTLESLIRSNSSNDYNGSSVLDKITTIHEIDKEVNRQLNNDIAMNYERLMDSKEALAKTIRKCNKNLNRGTGTGATGPSGTGATGPSGNENIIEHLQRRAELIDQDLRILSNTFTIIKENQQN